MSTCDVKFNDFNYWKVEIPPLRNDLSDDPEFQQPDDLSPANDVALQEEYRASSAIGDWQHYKEESSGAATSSHISAFPHLLSCGSSSPRSFTSLNQHSSYFADCSSSILSHLTEWPHFNSSSDDFSSIDFCNLCNNICDSCFTNNHPNYKTIDDDKKFSCILDSSADDTTCILHTVEISGHLQHICSVCFEGLFTSYPDCSPVEKIQKRLFCRRDHSKFFSHQDDDGEDPDSVSSLLASARNDNNSVWSEDSTRSPIPDIFIHVVSDSSEDLTDSKDNFNYSAPLKSPEFSFNTYNLMGASPYLRLPSKKTPRPTTLSFQPRSGVEGSSRRTWSPRCVSDPIASEKEIDVSEVGEACSITTRQSDGSREVQSISLRRIPAPLTPCSGSSPQQSSAPSAIDLPPAQSLQAPAAFPHQLPVPSPASDGHSPGSWSRSLSPRTFHSQLVHLLEKLPLPTLKDNRYERASDDLGVGGCDVGDCQSARPCCDAEERRHGGEVKMGNRGSQPCEKKPKGEKGKTESRGSSPKLKSEKDTSPKAKQGKDSSPNGSQSEERGERNENRAPKHSPSVDSILVTSDSKNSLSQSFTEPLGSPVSDASSIISVGVIGGLPEVRIEPTSSPESSVSSSLYVDTQSQLPTPEDAGTVAEADSLLDADLIDDNRPPSPDGLHVTSELLYLTGGNITPQDVTATLKEDVSSLDSRDDDDLSSFHDTHEDASSCDTEASPQKEGNVREFLTTRSYPGTPDTQLESFHPFGSYPMARGERYSSVGNVHCRSLKGSLSPIGSTTRLDHNGNAEEDDDEREEAAANDQDEAEDAPSSSRLVPKFCVTTHHKVTLPPHRFRTPPPAGVARRELCNSELCLRAGALTVPQALRRYCSQHLVTPVESNCVLTRVASLTLDKATIEKKVNRPKFVPEKLDFSLYEKFEGKKI